MERRIAQAQRVSEIEEVSVENRPARRPPTNKTGQRTNPTSHRPENRTMKPLHLALSASLLLAAMAGAAVAAEPTAKPAKPPAARAAASVDPAALQALQRMSAYLRTLTQFEITTTNAVELVLNSGQKIENDRVTTYKVKTPDKFVIETTSDQRVRQYVYDGKQLTVSSPLLGVYATVPAPPTIIQTLNAAADKYGVVLPLADLFSWSDPNGKRFSDLKSGVYVGTATLDGVKTDQYAFQEAKIDWQIWIAQGDKPLPLKVVIIGLEDPAHPAFSSRLNWNTNPSLAADTFEFHPAKDAMAIKFASSSK